MITASSTHEVSDDDGIDIKFLNVHRRFLHKPSSTDTPLQLRKTRPGLHHQQRLIEHNLERHTRKASEHLMDEEYPPEFFRYQIVQM
ncbi:hypothetical protein K457DRAFT_22076 [Linnemannia elongata AG-77]|uniref:Uncharacterized protein n=1 Tax=Linnemannia elongata AG-77 TaxID=1314771 RepID=A0A197JN69_9FUNG|nr:hypothetical protein K457DRAFT_22076 [Linnemannia elongata AG-77]